MVPFKDIRGVTYYPFPRRNGLGWDSMTWYLIEEFDFGILQNDFRKMKEYGFNTVWFVLRWMDFEPVVLPEENRIFNQVSFNNLKRAIEIASQEDIVVILPLNYLGEGWSPGGIDWYKWQINNSMWGGFYYYVVEMAYRLRDYSNVIFLVFSEGIKMDGEPERRLLREDPEVYTHFRNWAYLTNSDLSYWNSRWYPWLTMVPLPPSSAEEILTPQRWYDHYRWVSWISKNTIGGLANIIKQWGNPNVKVGYHDCCIIRPGLEITDLPIPNGHQVDFFSFAVYPESFISVDPSYWVSMVNDVVHLIGEKLPGLPIVMGETGMDTSKWTEEQQYSIMRAILQRVISNDIGFNIWMWKDFEFSPQTNMDYMGLVSTDDSEKYILTSIKQLI